MGNIKYYDDLLYKAKIIRAEDDFVFYVYVATDDILKAIMIVQDYCKNREHSEYTFICAGIENMDFNPVLIDIRE